MVRAPNWLGDAIMCMPFLKKLREMEPEACIDVLCRSSIQEVFQNCPHVCGVLSFDQTDGFMKRISQIRKGHYTTGYILPPSFSSALLFFGAGIPERVGYATDFRRLFLTKALPLNERCHYVRRYLGLLGCAGHDVHSTDFYFPKPLNKSQLVKSIPIKPILAIAPGSRAPARRWPAVSFAHFINSLSIDEWPAIILVGAPEDDPFAQEVAVQCQRPVSNLCGKTTLTQLGCLLKESSALVTNESGMMHVAWAVNTPTVVLAGPSEPRATSPFGAQVKILQQREVPCVPCIKNDCFRLGDDFMECMKRIDADSVSEALKHFHLD